MDFAKADICPGGTAESARLDDFNDVVERYQALVWSVAFAITGDRSLSEDVAQETFLAAWKQQADIRDLGKLRGYLATIARNLGRKAIRGAGREAALGDEHYEAVDTWSPLDDILKREHFSQVTVALGQMPLSSREAFVLFYAKGQCVARVAADLDLSQSAVKQRLYRARETLKDSLHATLSQAVLTGSPGKACVVATMALILEQSAGAGIAYATMGEVSASAPTAQGLPTSTIGALGKTAAGLALGGSAALIAFLSQVGMADNTRPPPDPTGAQSGAAASPQNHSLATPALASRDHQFEAAKAQVAVAPEIAAGQRLIATRIQEKRPNADIDGDGQLSEDEILVLRDAQEDELTELILEHWQDKPYGVTCVFLEQGDDAQVQEGWTPYKLDWLRARYEDELKAGLRMDAKEWLSSQVATVQGERICYEIHARYHDEVHELRANAKGGSLPWVASVSFEGQPCAFLRQRRSEKSW